MTIKEYITETMHEDDEIEDIVGMVEYTDSQKSVATTNIYSQDFTDSSSDKNNSSGKDTYVIEYDSEESDLEPDKKQSAINIEEIVAVKVGGNDHKITHEGAHCNHKYTGQINSKEKLNHVHVQCESAMSRSASTSLHRCSFVSKETFTQTSKTVFELAQLDSAIQSADYKAMETQTSFVSIIKNKTFEYRVEVDSHMHFSRNEYSKSCKDGIENTSSQNYDNELTNTSEIACLQIFPSNGDNNYTPEFSTGGNSTDMLKIIDEEIKDIEENDFLENTSEYEDTSKFDSECEIESLQGEHYSEAKLTHQDNISETSVPISIDNDVEELYSNLKKSLDLRNMDRPIDFDVSRYITLSPLTEESTAVKRESFVDITPNNNIGTTEPEKNVNKDVMFRSKSGIEVQGQQSTEDEKKPFKLPPIHNQSCPSSLQLNSLFGIAPNKLGKASTLPSLFDADSTERWEIGTKDLASGESARISEKRDACQKSKEQCHLPSIYIEGHINYGDSNTVDSSRNTKSVVSDTPRETICIQEKIKDLKMGKGRRHKMSSKFGSVSPKSRSISPGSASPDEARSCDAAERGCEVLCQALIKRLQSQIWFEVIEVLDELPNALEKFWFVITEQRIADLIRQVSVHVDSPRTQVARTACTTLAAILKNTNYTKKPDFFEAVTCLLVKTGSYSKPVRRAANVALDDVVTGVEPGHAVTALCVHGVSHKSPLVRCAAARLLVVAAALAGGGRELLRARPPTAAHARRLALRALSALLDDKNTDARKYAERLYSMLRPQPNFEAYYLTDVEVDTATKQMKKYDQLFCGPSKESR